MDLLLRSDGPTWTGRRPAGVPVVRVMGISELWDTQTPRRGLLVSIRSPGVEPPRLPEWSGTVLRLEIEDVYADATLREGADMQTPAAAIARCVLDHPKARAITYQCQAGVSRGRSAAAAVCDHHGWPYRWHAFHQPLYHAVRAAMAELTTSHPST